MRKLRREKMEGLKWKMRTVRMKTSSRMKKTRKWK
jgi:hypothetical protein